MEKVAIGCRKKLLGSHLLGTFSNRLKDSLKNEGATVVNNRGKVLLLHLSSLGSFI